MKRPFLHPLLALPRACRKPTLTKSWPARDKTLKHTLKECCIPPRLEAYNPHGRRHRRLTETDAGVAQG